MTTPVLIGVGGTGQTVLIAYLRLAELAGFTPALFYALDSDTKGPLTETLTRFKSRVKQVVGGGVPPARWKIDPFPNVLAERKTFGTLFGNLTGERRALFDCLFSEEAEQTRIQTGMYGRPSIGATSIRYKILKDDEELKEMKNMLRGGEKHVILVGSCFGGTGSGGVPMLAQEFHRLKTEEQGYQALKVDAAIFLPWFRLIQPEGGVKVPEKSLHEHLNKNFEPNAAAGIHYFKDRIRNYVDTLFLFGVGNPGQISRISSEDAQGEAAHILNLLAASLIQSHFAEALRPPLGVVAYWYDADEGINPRSTMVYRNDSTKSSISLSNVIKRTALRVDWLDVLRTFFENYKRIDPIHKPTFLDLAIEKLTLSTRTDVQVIGDMVSCLEQARRFVADGYNWLEKMDDKQFFYLKVDEKRVLGIQYETMHNNPLPIINRFCNQEGLYSRFDKRDFETPENFCEKFSELFLQHLMKEFNL